jgi:hypothetical protein
VRGVAAFLLLLVAGSAEAQEFDGYVSTLFSVMPDVAPAQGRQPVSELRLRFFGEGSFNPSQAWHVRAGLFVDGLVADRGPLDPDGPAGAAIIRPADVYVEYRGTAFDLRAGTSRIVWGRLDEFQPTDVVNPLDLSRFLLEGRSEARLPVALVRGRVFLPASSTLEAILVPAFRAGRFDQLDEDTSPFRLALPGASEPHEPGVSLDNLQGGARFTSTLGRVDWGVSAWRGFESFPTFAGMFPRFTMIGADFETVRGPWGLRGEVAWYDTATPREFEGGIGADRRAGSYRVAINALVSHADGDTDASFVGWAERSFARETRQVRLLAVYDPSDDTAFIRGIGAFNLHDNVSLEASAGWFTGEPSGSAQSGTDVLALLSQRDFLYARLKVHF